MPSLRFCSSRNEGLNCELKEALFSPLASDGGLFCPEQITPFEDINSLKNLSYKELAIRILRQLNLQTYESEFSKSLAAYDEFDGGEAIRISQLNERHIIELWHGKTRAFKDMALAPLARFMHELDPHANMLICCATSGDTGPATLDAFEGKCKIVCIYPEGKTSAAQRAQMIKRCYQNALVLGIEGNFDDAQSALKSLLNDEEFKANLAAKNLNLGAANSLNFGRILFQIIYHFYAALQASEPIRVLVPSGNFGNALAAFYAKLLGAPIALIKVITNENCVLDEFFKTGRYDLRNRAFKMTASPAMDILKSSNLERLIYHFAGAAVCKSCYEQLQNEGYFELDDQYMQQIRKIFCSASTSDANCLATIKSTAALLDPHTACAYAQSEPNDFIASTAEWAKFAPTIAAALGETYSDEADYIASKEPSSALAALIKSEQIYAQFCTVAEIKSRILAWL